MPLESTLDTQTAKELKVFDRKVTIHHTIGKPTFRAILYNLNSKNQVFRIDGGQIERIVAKSVTLGFHKFAILLCEKHLLEERLQTEYKKYDLSPPPKKEVYNYASLEDLKKLGVNEFIHFLQLSKISRVLSSMITQFAGINIRPCEIRKYLCRTANIFCVRNKIGRRYILYYVGEPESIVRFFFKNHFNNLCQLGKTKNPVNHGQTKKVAKSILDNFNQ